MNWKMKSVVQRAIANLPPRSSAATYYWLQKTFGELRHADPADRLMVGLEVCRIVEVLGRSPVGADFLEIGTGRTIAMPLALWLVGANRIVTLDLNRYLKEDVIRSDLAYIEQNRLEIERIFGDRIFDDRLAKLLAFVQGEWRLSRLLRFLSIEYLAPGDASNLPALHDSMDFHVSNTVLEHISGDALCAILEEGRNLLRSNGLFVHRVDMSDHFSHSDRSISKIHFLQFSDEEWLRIAGNRYGYTNRLRLDDLVALFERAGHEILLQRPDLDMSIYRALVDKTVRVSSQFLAKSDETLATTGCWLVSKSNPNWAKGLKAESVLVETSRVG